jgi:hypothetical protein
MGAHPTIYPSIARALDDFDAIRFYETWERGKSNGVIEIIGCKIEDNWMRKNY